MELINQLISEYGMQIIGTVLTAAASFIGLKIKNIYEKYINDKTKKDVVESTVKYVEQIYKDLKGQEKLDKAIEGATEILNEKGITITELELRVLIESVCNSFAKSVKEN